MQGLVALGPRWLAWPVPWLAVGLHQLSEMLLGSMAAAGVVSELFPSEAGKVHTEAFWHKLFARKSEKGLDRGARVKHMAATCSICKRMFFSLSLIMST